MNEFDTFIRVIAQDVRNSPIIEDVKYTITSRNLTMEEAAEIFNEEFFFTQGVILGKAIADVLIEYYYKPHWEDLPQWWRYASIVTTDDFGVDL